jgi:hypothetical protein
MDRYAVDVRIPGFSLKNVDPQSVTGILSPEIIKRPAREKKHSFDLLLITVLLSSCHGGSIPNQQKTRI